MNRIGKDHVGSCLGVGFHPFASGLNAFGGNGVGSGNDDEGVVLSGHASGFNLFEHFLRRNDFLARHVAAALGAHLVLNVDTRHTGFFKYLDGVVHIHRVAIARVRIGSDGDVHRSREIATMVGVFRQAHHAGIGHTQQGVGDRCATGCCGFKACSLDQSHAVAVIDAWRHNEFAAV